MILIFFFHYIMQHNDIYTVIRNDFIRYTETSYFVYDDVDILLWIEEYISNMSSDNKKQLYDKYGHMKLFSKLGEIAELHHWNFYNDFIMDENKVVEITTISYIITTDIIHDILPPIL